MSPVALLPLAVFIVGLVTLGVMVARVADEAEQLRAELRRMGQLRPLLVEIGDGSQRLRAALARTRR